ncbi:hypothetical protein Tco_0544966 [Tanacetum coccineum]
METRIPISRICKNGIRRSQHIVEIKHISGDIKSWSLLKLFNLENQKNDVVKYVLNHILDSQFQSRRRAEEIILIRASGLKKIQHEVMAELLLNKCMEKAQTESNLSITNTNNDMNIKLNNEFLTDLQNNAYHGIHHEDVVDHIAMVLEMLDLINIPGMDSHQLRMKVFPLSLADDAQQCWNKRRMDDKILSSGDTTTDSILESYLKTQEKNNTEKDDERRQTKRKYNDADLETNNNERPNKRMCNAKMFEAVKYSLGPNEEYIAIKRCEYDTWERNKDTMS